MAARRTPEVLGRVESVERDRLSLGSAGPDGRIAAIPVPCLHELGERGTVTDRIEIGVLLHVVVARVAALDRRLD